MQQFLNGAQAHIAYGLPHSNLPVSIYYSLDKFSTKASITDPAPEVPLS
jgi:hypothetical protein